MAGPGFSRLNLARAMKVAALLLFLLPWATVSCDAGRLGNSAEFEMTGAPREVIARPSGLALATGTVRFMQVPPSAGAAPPPNPLAGPEPFVIAGAALTLLALALPFFVAGARGRLAALGATMFAAGMLAFAVFVRLPDMARDYALALIASDGGGTPALDPQELVRMIEVTAEPGFWLTLAALAAAAMLLIADRFRLPA
jgi:hypothetical protein